MTLERFLLPSDTLLYALSVALAVTFVAAAGLLVSVACRRGSAPFRHGLLVATLMVILLCPLAVALGPRLGWGGLPLRSPADDDVPRVAAPSLDAAAENPAPLLTIPLLAALEGGTPPARTRAEEISKSPAEETPDNSAELGGSRAPTWPWHQALGTALVAVWACGALASGIGLLRGLIVLAQFSRALRPSSVSLTAIGARAAQLVGLRVAPLIRSGSRISVPVSIGIVRPTIVFPDDLERTADEAQLQAMAVHEAAHLARRDHWVALGQRIADVLFWWNPLVRRLGQRTADLCEDICDNYVIGAQSNGPWLAELLVDMAARMADSTRLPATVGILTPKLDGLAGRIGRLVDRDRNTAVRPNGRAMIAVGVFAVLLGAAALTTHLEAETPPPDRAAAKDGAADLAGVWRVESAVRGKKTENFRGLLEILGRAFTAPPLPMQDAALAVEQTEALRGGLVLFTANTVVFRSPAATLASGRYAADPTQHPAAIDLWTDHKLSLGIYQLEGDRLTLHLDTRGQPRPTGFDADASAASNILVVLVRERNAPLPAASQAENRVLPEPSGGRPLWLAQADGSARKCLLAMSEYTSIGSPDWSRDGTRIACDAWRSRRGEDYHQAHIFALGADGKGVADCGPGAMPSWSPDGKRIALSMYEPFQGVWIMNADGAGRQLLAADGWAAEWSPRTNEIAYTTYDLGANICVYNLTTGARRQLLEVAQQRIWWGLGWSPDGKQLAFKAIDHRGRNVIAVVDAAGSRHSARVILDGPAAQAIEACLSWGRRGILGYGKLDGDRVSQLYVLDPAGHQPPARLPPAPAGTQRGNAAWSPDGKQFVFGEKVPESTVSQ